MKKRLKVAFLLCLLILIIITALGVYLSNSIIIYNNSGPSMSYPYGEHIGEILTLNIKVQNNSFIPIRVLNVEIKGINGLEEKRKVSSQSEYGFTVSDKIDEVDRNMIGRKTAEISKLYIKPKTISNIIVSYEIKNNKPVLPKEIIIKYKYLFFKLSRNVYISYSS